MYGPVYPISCRMIRFSRFCTRAWRVTRIWSSFWLAAPESRPCAEGCLVSPHALASSLVTPSSLRVTQSRRISFALRLLNIPVRPPSRFRNCGVNPAGFVLSQSWNVAMSDWATSGCDGPSLSAAKRKSPSTQMALIASWVWWALSAVSQHRKRYVATCWPRSVRKKSMASPRSRSTFCMNSSCQPSGWSRVFLVVLG